MTEKNEKPAKKAAQHLHETRFSRACPACIAEDKERPPVPEGLLKDTIFLHAGGEEGSCAAQYQRAKYPGQRIQCTDQIFLNEAIHDEDLRIVCVRRHQDFITGRYEIENGARIWRDFSQEKKVSGFYEAEAIRVGDYVRITKSKNGVRGTTDISRLVLAITESMVGYALDLPDQDYAKAPHQTRTITVG